MEWILEEVLENLKNERNALAFRIDQYSEYEDSFKSAVATDDKFEVGRHEYWRGRYLEAIENYERIKAMINDVYDMIDEDIKRCKEAEREMDYLRGDSHGQL